MYAVPRQCLHQQYEESSGLVCDPMDGVDRACIGSISAVTAYNSNTQCKIILMAPNLYKLRAYILS